METSREYLGIQSTRGSSPGCLVATEVKSYNVRPRQIVNNTYERNSLGRWRFASNMPGAETYVAYFSCRLSWQQYMQARDQHRTAQGSTCRRSHERLFPPSASIGRTTVYRNIVPTYINRNMDVSSICILHQLCSKKASFVAEMGASVTRG